VTLHQYGFWSDDGGRYTGPYYGRIGSTREKGSDFMWKAVYRKVLEDPGFLEPGRLANLSRDEWCRVFLTDDGECDLPMMDSHFEFVRAYGSDLVEASLTPAAIVAGARAASHPASHFLELCGRLSGYREDPLRKKAALLMVIMKNRPEGFLEVDEADLVPIVDYHIQRLFLRTGMVEVLAPEVRARLAARRFLEAAEEAAVRQAVFDAFEELAARSGKDIASLDFFFFSFRKRCDEVARPECDRCRLHQACRQRTDLFQPVFRTTFY